MPRSAAPATLLHVPTFDAVDPELPIRHAGEAAIGAVRDNLRAAFGLEDNPLHEYTRRRGRRVKLKITGRLLK